MQRIRVLIVDDSAVTRRIVRDVFSSDPSFEVVGAASNGRIALAMVQQLTPDLLTLDIEMPEMNGLDALLRIRKDYPQVHVIMFSTLTTSGAEATIEALSRGASDYVAKPSDVGAFSVAVERIREQLLPKAKALCSRTELASGPSRSRAPNASLQQVAASLAPQQSVTAVVIGTSTGGPNALSAVLPQLPADFPVPVLIVQHMPPLFTRFLADRLTACSRIAVAEATAGHQVAPGQTWIAPGDFHLSVFRDGTRVRLQTDQRPPENSCRPSVDVLFRSVADVYGAGVLAVVMTGMGQDGLIGCEHIKKRGGHVIVQDEPTSVVWGMPGFVAKAGLADRILPLQQIGPEIVRRVCHDRARHTIAALGRG